MLQSLLPQWILIELNSKDLKKRWGQMAHTWKNILWPALFIGLATFALIVAVEFQANGGAVLFGVVIIVLVLVLAIPFSVLAYRLTRLF